VKLARGQNLSELLSMWPSILEDIFFTINWYCKNWPLKESRVTWSRTLLPVLRILENYIPW